MRPYQNNFLLDGVDNNSLSEDLVSQQSFVIGPPPDAIAEFKVQTNSMSAEFGRSGGAVLNVTIKSGTNQLHGTAYEFLRNSALDAKNFFDDPVHPIPPFKLNQFGFSVGGPVLIPKVYNGKNRTFFFFDYQGTRIRTGQTLSGYGAAGCLAHRRFRRVQHDLSTRFHHDGCERQLHAHCRFAGNQDSAVDVESDRGEAAEHVSGTQRAWVRSVPSECPTTT